MSDNASIILGVLFRVVYWEMEPEIDWIVTVFLRPSVGGKHTPLLPSSSSDAYIHNIIAIAGDWDETWIDQIYFCDYLEL